MTRIPLLVVGVLVVVVGVVFAGQGANLIPGSFMTGDRTWLAVGIVMIVVGAIAVVYGVRRPPAR
ncbi:hypothetical protein [Amnibacterium endophyticum]|uniref:Uncharacterized protein n=1 Tax=Amnibacterium endophyticum TaxID=2109337 RepID=A0ABW4LCY4_9MICO